MNRSFLDRNCAPGKDLDGARAPAGAEMKLRQLAVGGRVKLRMRQEFRNKSNYASHGPIHSFKRTPGQP